MYFEGSRATLKSLEKIGLNGLISKINFFTFRRPDKFTVPEKLVSIDVRKVLNFNLFKS